MENVGLLFLRVCVGLAMMIGHGWPKLANYSMKAAHFPDPLGVGSEISLGLAIFAEFFCPIFIILGLFTRVAALPILMVMIVAVLMIHGNDPWKSKELAVLYAIPCLALILTGAGDFSIDKMIKKKRG